MKLFQIEITTIAVVAADDEASAPANGGHKPLSGANSGFMNWLSCK